jgi:L-cysteine:1D-myo-inositol 2-amino-2-deoxy-alpha-D-glucopyranoside ligase
MSKSLGNLVFPRDLFRDHEPAAVRLALLTHHWRSEWEWDPAELKEATERLSAWRGACGQPESPDAPVGYPPVRGPHQPGVGGDPWPEGRAAGGPGAGAAARLPGAVDAALAADLDTPAALAVGDELAERGDGAGVAATAAVLGVDLGPATG